MVIGECRDTVGAATARSPPPRSIGATARKTAAIAAKDRRDRWRRNRRQGERDRTQGEQEKETETSK
jgi:hypothetical protein